MKTFEDAYTIISWLSERDLKFWTHASGGEIRLSFNMNDYFYWGCADFEDIYIEDLPLLEEVERDLKATGEPYADCYISELFACRKRKQAPQGAVFKERFRQEHPKIVELLLACQDSPREINLGNPYTPEGKYEYKVGE